MLESVGVTSSNQFLSPKTLSDGNNHRARKSSTCDRHLLRGHVGRLRWRHAALGCSSSAVPRSASEYLCGISLRAGILHESGSIDAAIRSRGRHFDPRCPGITVAQSEGLAETVASFGVDSVIVFFQSRFSSTCK